MIRRRERHERWRRSVSYWGSTVVAVPASGTGGRYCAGGDMTAPKPMMEA